jgi:hypothetical protein
MTETPTFPKSLDSTMVSSYTDCPQKFFLEFCLKLAPIAVSPDLHAGGALASAFEVARKAFYFDGLPQDRAIEMGFAEFTRFWGDYEPPEKHAKTFINCGFAFTEYFNQYSMVTDHLNPIRLPDGRPAVEYTFAIPTKVPHPETGEPILFSGRCDLVAELTNNNNAIAVVDEKTSKSIGNSFYRKWGLRGQFRGYAYALREAGINVEYALVRGIALQVTQTQFCEVLVPIADYSLDRWWVATNQKIAEIANRWKYMQGKRETVKGMLDQGVPIPDYQVANHMNAVSHDAWTYAFGEPCEQFFGCAFKQLCLSQHPHMSYDNYERRYWDPLAKNPTEGSVDTLQGMTSTELPIEAQILLKGATNG